MVRTQEGFLAEDDLGASDVYEREDADAQEVRSQLCPLLLLLTTLVDYRTYAQVRKAWLCLPSGLLIPC